MEATSLRFAAAARVIASAARRAGLRVPGFRSPPRMAEVERSLRRRSDGNATVSIRLRGRPWPAVLADMIEGVIATNRLSAGEADRARGTLWAALETEDMLPAPPPAPPPVRAERKPRLVAPDPSSRSAAA